MIKVDNIDVWGFEHAIRGMRNPLASWHKSDSGITKKEIAYDDYIEGYQIGPADIDLMRRLYKAGTEHRKYLRQIFVSMDITAPLYWWKEADTYKVGTVANSCSTMHTIHKKPFTLDDFSSDNLDDMDIARLEKIIMWLNDDREMYIDTKEKQHWHALIKLLPESYNQKRTITMNYENVMNMIHQRTGHKLAEWNEFVTILKELPYISEIMR